MTTTARVFKSGNSQAIRLPKEFRVDCSELEIIRCGKDIILREPCIKKMTLAEAFDILASVSKDVPIAIEEARKNDVPQERESFD